MVIESLSITDFTHTDGLSRFLVPGMIYLLLRGNLLFFDSDCVSYFSYNCDEMSRGSGATEMTQQVKSWLHFPEDLSLEDCGSGQSSLTMQALCSLKNSASKEQGE